MDVDRPRLPVIGAAAQLLEQLAAREDAAGSGREHAQELELDEGELHLTAPNLDGAARNVDPQLARVDHLLRRAVARPGRGGTAQERTDTAAELADREGLRDVVVRAELEAEHLVELVVTRREHDDRHGALGPQPLAHLEPVQLRQHQVEHDEVEGAFAEPGERLLAVAGGDDAEPVALERVGEELLHGLLVVDEEDGRAVGHARMVETAALLPTLGGRWRRPDEPLRPGRGPAAGRSSGRSTLRWCAERGCSSRCRSCSRRSRSAGHSPCRRRRSRPRSTRRRRGSSRAELARLNPDRSPGSSGALAATDWTRRQLRAVRLPASDRPLPGADSRPRPRRARECRGGRPRLDTARDRRPGAPRQQRRRARRERQRVRNRRLDRARPRVCAGVGDEGADAADAHARLRLDRRRRIRSARRGAVRRHLTVRATTRSRCSASMPSPAPAGRGS